MKLYCYILLFLFTGLSITCQAQTAPNEELLVVVEYELAGQWTGKLSQRGYNLLSASYDFELTLTVKGDKISGYSYIKVDSNYAKIKLSGRRNGLKIEITESEILDSSIKKDYFWCIKRLHLEFGYEEGRYRLKGPWDGKNGSRDCSPGDVILYKDAIRA